MLGSLGRKLNAFFLGEITHSYDPIEVVHGPITCSDRFEIRRRKDVSKLFHERVWQDGHTVKKNYREYTAEDVGALFEVFAGALERVPLQESHDFGQILETRDGRMQSRVFFYIEASGGEHHLFSRDESQSRGSSHTATTYFPLEEVRLITDVLTTAQGRLAGC